MTQALRDEIRYGDNESPYDELDDNEKLLHLFFRTGIFGPMEVMRGATEAHKYGSSMIENLSGPMITKLVGLLEGVVDAVGNGSPRTLAREMKGLVPLLNQFPIATDIGTGLMDDVFVPLVEGLQTMSPYEKKKP